MAAPAIRTRDLSKDYHVGFWRPRPYRALDRLSIDVAAGDVFGFLGPNGAGKTPTLKLLMQLVFPTSGEAERRLAMRKSSPGMLQRVGLAQAVPNDPEVLFLDEPMSGLDPLGRRDVRALMLELRDQGRTIFFSSHILSDAEALCSQVAIVAKGRLAAAGRLTDLQEFAIQGWELVMANVPAAALERVRTRARRVLTIAGDRYVIDLP